MNGKVEEVEQEFSLHLNDDFTVFGENGRGKWTLIYDEGWEIDYAGVKYTHFFKYFKDNRG